jgi:hypothetical protein
VSVAEELDDVDWTAVVCWIEVVKFVVELLNVEFVTDEVELVKVSVVSELVELVVLEALGLVELVAKVEELVVLVED